MREMMLMVDDRRRAVPPWPAFDELLLPASGGGDCSPYLFGEAAAALRRYTAASFAGEEGDEAALRRYTAASFAGEEGGDEAAPDLVAVDVPVDAYSCDEFRMYEFKIRRCTRGRSHDWTECPFAHPGEKARRRDPRRYHYSGASCPDYRKGAGGGAGCKRGDACEFAHGVFEIWLHPSRYRTQPCKDGTACRRRVCFFAHTPEQLRVLTSGGGGGPKSYDGSPIRHGAGAGRLSSSPNSTLMFSPPPPSSESAPRSEGRRASVSELLESLSELQLMSKAKSGSGSGWGLVSPRGTSFMSPDGGAGGFGGSPAMPRMAVAAALFDADGARRPEGRVSGGGACREEVAPAPVVVESGRALREKMMERVRAENGLERAATEGSPDVGWVSELVK